MLGLLSEVLEEYVAILGDIDPEALLFASPDDPTRPMSYQTIYGHFVRTLKSAKLPKVTVHSLRHTFASTMLSAGVPVSSVSRDLGHSSPTVTWAVYAHEVVERLGESLDRADQAFRAPPDDDRGGENEGSEIQPDN